MDSRPSAAAVVSNTSPKGTGQAGIVRKTPLYAVSEMSACLDKQ